MAEKEKKPAEISRRDFLKDAGLLVGGAAIGSTVLLAACAGEGTTETVTNTTTQVNTKTVTVEIPVDLPKSGVIQWNPDECGACSRCLMACATYHEGAVAPQLSRIFWVDNDFINGFKPRKPLFCQQCAQPECLSACPLGAIKIDSETGARYVDKDICQGRGLCIKACPFEVSRINFDDENKLAIKCDLCKDRAGGPACVEVCDRNALTYITKEERVF